MAPPDGITVWIIEDGKDYRETVAGLLRNASFVSSVDGFSSAEEALSELNRRVAPQVFLVDIGLPGIDGVECVSRIRRCVPNSEVVMLTIHEDPDTIFRAICAGAAGYLPKTSTASEIEDAIRTVSGGGAAMNAQIARRVLTLFSQFAAPAWDYKLSTRETETLQPLVEGRSKADIADKLHLSVHTVDSHVRNVYSKLEVHSRSAAVAKALRERLV